MNISQMKNILVLKDLPSNIIDEAIVILKNNSKIKKKEIVEKGSSNKFEEGLGKNYDLAVKEAEVIIQDYIKNIEKPKEMKGQNNKIISKYRKLQVFSFLLGLTLIIAIIVNIVR